MEKPINKPWRMLFWEQRVARPIRDLLHNNYRYVDIGFDIDQRFGSAAGIENLRKWVRSQKTQEIERVEAERQRLPGSPTGRPLSEVQKLRACVFAEITAATIAEKEIAERGGGLKAESGADGTEGPPPQPQPASSPSSPVMVPIAAAAAGNGEQGRNTNGSTNNSGLESLSSMFGAHAPSLPSAARNGETVVLIGDAASAGSAIHGSINVGFIELGSGGSGGEPPQMPLPVAASPSFAGQASGQIASSSFMSEAVAGAPLAAASNGLSFSAPGGSANNSRLAGAVTGAPAPGGSPATASTAAVGPMGTPTTVTTMAGVEGGSGSGAVALSSRHKLYNNGKGRLLPRPPAVELLHHRSQIPDLRMGEGGGGGGVHVDVGGGGGVAGSDATGVFSSPQAVRGFGAESNRVIAGGGGAGAGAGVSSKRPAISELTPESFRLGELSSCPPKKPKVDHSHLVNRVMSQVTSLNLPLEATEELAGLLMGKVAASRGGGEVRNNGGSSESCSAGGAEEGGARDPTVASTATSVAAELSLEERQLVLEERVQARKEVESAQALAERRLRLMEEMRSAGDCVVTEEVFRKQRLVVLGLELPRLPRRGGGGNGGGGSSGGSGSLGSPGSSST